MAWTARRDLLYRLQDAYEHSVSFGKPGPWRRDVIVRLDAKAFPEAFAPDGRTRREALFLAASHLAEEGTAVLERHVRGPLRGEPKSVRVGPAQVASLEAGALREGLVPLSDALDVFRVALESEDSGARPEWFRAWVRTGIERIANADTSTFLGMGRPRFKHQIGDLKDALRGAATLATGIDECWERVLSERLFRDSKRLAAVRTHVVNMLVRCDPQWDGIPPDEAFDLLEAYGVRRKPGLIRCAGRGSLRIGKRDYLLEDFAPAAHLPDSWASSWASGVAASGVRTLTTIENEYPFLSYVDERGGHVGLGRENEVVVYTAGFPTPALVRALETLLRLRPEIAVRHWGDADVGGIRIWSFLREKLLRPIRLFRTSADWVRSESKSGGRSLSGPERGALARMRSALGESVEEDRAEARLLIDALLETGVKLEQERF